VLGKTRAKQFYSDDAERTQSAAVLLHGDGAFSGQGIVFETLDLCGLFDYTVGGTIHLVVNNQVTEGATLHMRLQVVVRCQPHMPSLWCPVQLLSWGNSIVCM
jgi:2-oxoglutarate dehydrogenase complex dehydrogenase (E1) component-like enzyme